MALVTGKLANLSGKVGDFVFRQVGTKTFMINAPKFKNKPPDEKKILKQEKFTLSGRLTDSLRLIPGLRFSFDRIAMAPKKRGDVFSHFFKELQGLDCTSVQLLPKNDFIFSIKESAKDASGFVITTNPVGNDSGIYAAKEVNVTLYALLVLFKEGKRAGEKFQCVPAASVTQKSSLNKELTFKIGLSPLQQSFLSESKQAFLLVALVISDSNGNTIKNSNTICVSVY